MNLSNLKRSVFALIAVLGIAGFSSPASAGGVYFGINLELVGGPIDLRFDREFRIVPLPIAGVQLGYDFGENGDGYGARMSFNFLIFGQIAADVYHRFSLDVNGSNAYVGAGVEYQFIVFDTSVGAPAVHALVGLEWRATPNLALFIEATPGLLLQLPAVAPTIILRGGLLLRF